MTFIKFKSNMKTPESLLRSLSVYNLIQFSFLKGLKLLNRLYFAFALFQPFLYNIYSV